MGNADPAVPPAPPSAASPERPLLGTPAPLAASLEQAAAGRPLLADVQRLAILQFAGADAPAFLHGQLSCHVTELASGAATWGSYSTPKGRMLASFLLLRGSDDLVMLLDRSIAAAVGKRLRMFVLRSKVTITDRTGEWSVVGMAGRDPASVDAGASLRWARLGTSRALGIGPVDAARALVAGVPDVLLADEAAWRWLDVCDGLPWITAATQDALVPQMANLDRIGGVHFQKGCYPGQEIVARTQYLGQVKRRMVLGRVDGRPAADAAPVPGLAVYGSDLGDQASGVVVDAAPAPGGGFDVLAVMHTSTATGGRATLGAPDGPQLQLRPLPYAFD